MHIATLAQGPAQYQAGHHTFREETELLAFVHPLLLARQCGACNLAQNLNQSN